MRTRRRPLSPGGKALAFRADHGRPLWLVGPSSPPVRRPAAGAWLRFAAAAAALAVCAGGAGPTRPGPSDRAARDAAVAEAVGSLGEGARAAVWVGGATGGPSYSWKADDVLPTASAIKTAFLVELFDRQAGALDRPPPGLEHALRDDDPAMAPYSAEQRRAIREALSGASARRLGRVMMASDPAPNAVYNAAASAVTALAGGPEGLTRAIRSRGPEFSPYSVRRYMLAPRNVTGDNESSAAAMAAVLRGLAVGRVAGLSAETVAEARAAVKAEDGRFGLKGRHRVKGGALDTDPVTRVDSGWWEAPSGGPVIYVVVLTRPARAGASGADVEEACRKLTARLLNGLAR